MSEDHGKWHDCPVCFYPGLTGPPADRPTEWSICPCCGTEFDLDYGIYDDDELRENWLAKGAIWFSDATRPPADWDARKQLEGGER